MFRQYIEKAGKDRMLSVLNYVYTAGTIDDEDEFGDFLNDIKPKLEDNVMTLRERAVQEGFDKGIEKGIEKGMEKGMERAIHQLALKMLTIGESVKKIMAISGLSAAEILSLKNRVHNTDTV